MNNSKFNDILKDWFIFRESSFDISNDIEDKKHIIYLDDFYEKILENVPQKNQEIIKEQFKLIDENVLDYITYCNEKYYINGFCDGIKLISSIK